MHALKFPSSSDVVARLSWPTHPSEDEATGPNLRLVPAPDALQAPVCQCGHPFEGDPPHCDRCGLLIVPFVCHH